MSFERIVKTANDILSNHDFTISFRHVGPDGQMHRYCLVQYSFKGSKEHPILQRQHKNTKSRSRVPYVRTWESTKDLLKQKSSEMNPREVVHKTIADDLGGISSCSGLGQLPRDRQQVCYEAGG